MKCITLTSPRIGDRLHISHSQHHKLYVPTLEEAAEIREALTTLEGVRASALDDVDEGPRVEDDLRGNGVSRSIVYIHGE